jgi:hypothetical protein
VEHARVLNFRDHMLLRNQTVEEAVQYGLEHRPSEAKVAAEVIRLETKLTMPTEPRLTPEEARLGVADALENPGETQTRVEETPSSEEPDNSSRLTLLDGTNDLRNYIDDLHDEMKKAA